MFCLSHVVAHYPPRDTHGNSTAQHSTAKHIHTNGMSVTQSVLVYFEQDKRMLTHALSVQMRSEINDIWHTCMHAYRNGKKHNQILYRSITTTPIIRDNTVCSKYKETNLLFKIKIHWAIILLLLLHCSIRTIEILVDDDMKAVLNYCISNKS